MSRLAGNTPQLGTHVNAGTSDECRHPEASTVATVDFWREPASLMKEATRNTHGELTI